MEKYIEDQHFENISRQPLLPAEYDGCTFTGCDFSEVDFSAFSFNQCHFTDCNLSMVKLHKTALKDVRFSRCKLLGVHFDDCSEFLFEVYFEDSMIQVCTFMERNLKKTRFIRSEIKECDFSSANLTDAVFDQCDLTGTLFENCNLEKADFRTSFNYILDPEKNKLKKTRFSLQGLPGLLAGYDIRID